MINYNQNICYNMQGAKVKKAYYFNKSSIELLQKTAQEQGVSASLLLNKIIQEVLQK